MGLHNAQALHMPSPEAPEAQGIDAALISTFPSYPYKVPVAPDIETGNTMG